MYLAEKNDQRYEIKFVTSPQHSSLVLNWINLHKYGFSKAYEDRRVNNIYFDKYDYFAYSENISGTSERKKLRYRWYGENDFPAPGRFEVKSRRNMFGWKKVYDVNNLSALENSSRPMHELKESIGSVLDGEGLLLFENNPHSVMLNRYQRKYFISNDQKVRITYDSGLSVYEQRYKPYINTRWKTNIPETIIVEVKCSREDREILSDVVFNIPIRVSRNSKYVNAVRCMTSY